ncbi:hypothetical protein [Deinococcus sp. QL22]|uniref:hypothetical protein n=1 Tax=Deinococcus sp. QL22 TaxID=2939437 RepID=UPI0020171980|nr:hypothetical protein [Deinococcus sp. QL22]UQN06162.1 hypothetical protein M1R55_15070 [Deinococcus sp. QL22]
MAGPLSSTYFYRYRGMDLPTKIYVPELHDDVLEVSEGRAGVAHIGVIESAVNKRVTS